MTEKEQFKIELTNGYISQGEYALHFEYFEKLDSKYYAVVICLLQGDSPERIDNAKEGVKIIGQLMDSYKLSAIDVLTIMSHLLPLAKKIF